MRAIPFALDRATSLAVALAALVLLSRPLPAVEGEPLRVCVTVPDLGDLLRAVGGDQVSVTVFTRGPQDAHFLEARPSFIRLLNRADLYVQNGLELEVDWAPVLLRNARNARILPGAAAHLDVSKAVTPIKDHSGPVDRSRGDIHVLGNPHYLLDPLNGLLVARTIRDRLMELRPAGKEILEKRYRSFRRKLVEALMGDRLAGEYGDDEIDTLLDFLERRGLKTFVRFLETRKQASLLGGWLGLMLPNAGKKVVADHNLWPYFARRFEISLLGFLEPRPGISPTTRHLAELIQKMRREGVRAILSVPYFDDRHAHFVARHTGAAVVPMAHQTGARSGTDSYVAAIDHNVRQLAAALARPPGKVE